MRLWWGRKYFEERERKRKSELIKKMNQFLNFLEKEVNEWLGFS